jgi:hypothetical protein
MYYLQRNLEEAIKEVGDVCNQISASESGKSAQEIYIEGTIKRKPVTRDSDKDTIAES